MTQIYTALVSGKFPNLAVAEIKGVLEAEKIRYKIIGVYGQLVRISAETDAIKAFSRLAATHLVIKELSFCELKDLVRAIKKIDWGFLIDKTFAVRVKKSGVISDSVNSMELERRLGTIIKKASNAVVKLKNPDVTVQVLITSNLAAVGVLAVQRPKGYYGSRRPRNRPFFHPSTLDAITARILVNLSRCRRGNLLLDPFVGAGGILIEAAEIGCTAIGIDIEDKIINGCRRNLEYYNLLSYTDLILGDVTNLWFRPTAFDSVVTDPPYGRSASTHGRDPRKIISNLLYLAKDVLVKEGFLVFMHPAAVLVDDLIQQNNFTIIEKYHIIVHKNLTRIVEVARND